MKTAITCMFMLLATVLTPNDMGQKSKQATEIRIPDAAAAIKVAEPALIKVYGKKNIEYEKPLTATLEGGVWHVYGTLCCPDKKGQRTCEEGRCVGGVAHAEVRQSDGKVLSITHTK